VVEEGTVSKKQFLHWRQKRRERRNAIDEEGDCGKGFSIITATAGWKKRLVPFHSPCRGTQKRRG